MQVNISKMKSRISEMSCSAIFVVVKDMCAPANPIFEFYNRSKGSLPSILSLVALVEGSGWDLRVCLQAAASRSWSPKHGELEMRSLSKFEREGVEGCRHPARGSWALEALQEQQGFLGAAAPE